MLADIPFGVNDTAMFVNGFTRETIVDLVRGGLATAERENLKAGLSIGGSGSLRPAGGRSKVIEHRP